MPPPYGMRCIVYSIVACEADREDLKVGGAAAECRQQRAQRRERGRGRLFGDQQEELVAWCPQHRLEPRGAPNQYIPRLG